MGAEAEERQRSPEFDLRTLGELAETMDGANPHVTIRPDPSTAQTMHTPHGTSMPELEAALATWKAPREPLELRRTIGEGGMGLVHLGYQRTLARPVAVKAIKRELLSPRSVKKLLSEARITGSLEHPNVVPVHDIATDADGAPLIVLKRIEGVHWGELIADPAEQRTRFGVDDPLEWNLRALVSVTNAIAFAHSRGVLHRDLKPENVMIGSFGEVYVLDWGLAVRLDDAPALPDIDVPRVSDAVQMAGTPSYMAPEMLGGDPPRLSERTDVYLLGAILYEILTGTPPHVGERMVQVLHSVAQSAPTFPVEEPAELVAIAKRAMARDPGDRFPTAEAFRDAITDYLSHRASFALSREAEKREAELREHLANEGGADEAGEQWDGRLAALFAECRFGYDQALASWLGNERAREGKQRTLTMMARRALAEDDARGAARLMHELGTVDEELSREVERALADERARREELARLRGDRDPRVGQRTRAIVSIVLGTFWTVGPVLAYVTGTSYGLDAFTLAAPPLALLGVVAAFAWWKRELILSTAINRQLTGATAITMIAEASIHSGGALAGLSPAQTQSMALVLFGVMSAAMGLMAATPLLVPAVGYLIAFFVAARFPESRAYAQACANLLLTVVAYAAWSRAATRSADAQRPA